jgi:tripartite-type tricarboxylate transporter receptor subunit TctC
MTIANRSVCFSNILFAALLVLGTACAPAIAADYPTHPITIIVPFAAGGPSDLAIRTISDRLSRALGQPLVTENVPGAGGMIGTSRVARAAPDGYTLLVHQNALAISPGLYPKQSIDVEKELTGVGMVNTSYSFLVGSTNVPANDLKELIAWMKGPGKPAKFAHPGIGTLAHLQAILFAREVGAEVTLIGYRGGGQAVGDIVGGHVDLLWAAPTTSAELIAAKKMKGFTFGAPNRYPGLADIPTVTEAGYPSLVLPFWQALFAPAATPKPVIDRLNAALREAVADENVLKAYVERGVEAYPADQMSPEFANALLRAELEKWSTLIRETKIEAEGN